jgi:hypothetical protein
MNRPEASDGFAADIRCELLIMIESQTNWRYLPSVLELCEGAQAGSLMGGCLLIQEERPEVVIEGLSNISTNCGVDQRRRRRDR